MTIPKKTIILWIVSFVSLTLLLAAVNAEQSLRLASSGVPALARVTARSGEHCRVELTFRVGDALQHTYQDDCDAAPGQELRITYLARDPRVACIGDPLAVLLRELVGAIVVGLVGATFVVVANWNRPLLRWVRW